VRNGNRGIKVTEANKKGLICSYSAQGFPIYYKENLLEELFNLQAFIPPLYLYR